jgi:hypothetical protein
MFSKFGCAVKFCFCSLRKDLVLENRLEVTLVFASVSVFVYLNLTLGASVCVILLILSSCILSACAPQLCVGLFTSELILPSSGQSISVDFSRNFPLSNPKFRHVLIKDFMLCLWHSPDGTAVCRSAVHPTCKRHDRLGFV